LWSTGLAVTSPNGLQKTVFLVLDSSDETHPVDLITVAC
jgi:hypothetical protein